MIHDALAGDIVAIVFTVIMGGCFAFAGFLGLLCLTTMFVELYMDWRNGEYVFPNPIRSWREGRIALAKKKQQIGDPVK